MPAAVSYKQLKVRSLMWPCKDRMDPGTPVLYTDGFATSSGKAKMWVGTDDRRPTTDDGRTTTGGNQDGMLMATVGFPLFPFRSGTLSRQSYGLSRVEPDPRLHLNTEDATRMGIADQVPVNVQIEGAPDSEPVLAISQVYDKVPPGTAFLAMTMEQAGTNAGVRMARHAIASDTTGANKSVAIRVQAVPGAAPSRQQDELMPAGTGIFLNPNNQAN
jgi:predicted molibdopterin-dependent oxidoreductase YjgC